jgi:hypothetical protein
MYPNKECMDNLRNSKLYQDAFLAFKSGDSKKGHELLGTLAKSNEFEPIKKHYEDNSEIINSELKSKGIVMINKNEPIPDGYHRNTFTDKTCITTQEKDLPEWSTIKAEVIYNGQSVYEDHYALRYTTQGMLYGIKKEHSHDFVGIIESQSSPEHTLSKFKKNSLYLIIDDLNIELSNVEYSVFVILNGISDNEYLKNVSVEHLDKIYSDEEIKQIKQLFKKSKLDSLKLGYESGKIDLMK